MDTTKTSKFQFRGYKIDRSVIERKSGEVSDEISIGFNPKGTIDKSESTFTLELGVSINDSNNVLNVSIDIIGDFYFDSTTELDTLSNYFYVNAPALLFPYIRAFISTLTNLSGSDIITLPTLNLTNLAEELKNNTAIIE